MIVFMKDNSSFNNWFLQGVYWVASKSKDPKTKIGAILVKDRRIISTGYNGIPMEVDDSINDRHQRPEKYKWYEHGERNAIYAATIVIGKTQNKSFVSVNLEEL